MAEQDTGVVDVEASASDVADDVAPTLEERFAALEGRHQLLDSELRGVKGIAQRAEGQLKTAVERQKSAEALLKELDDHVAAVLPVVERVRSQWKEEDPAGFSAFMLERQLKTTQEQVDFMAKHPAAVEQAREAPDDALENARWNGEARAAWRNVNALSVELGMGPFQAFVDAGKVSLMTDPKEATAEDPYATHAWERRQEKWLRTEKMRRDKAANPPERPSTTLGGGGGVTTWAQAQKTTTILSPAEYDRLVAAQG